MAVLLSTTDAAVALPKCLSLRTRSRPGKMQRSSAGSEKRECLRRGWKKQAENELMNGRMI